MTNPEIPHFQPAPAPCNCPNIGACDGSCAPYNAKPSDELPMVAQTAPAKIYLVIGDDCPQDISFRELCSRFDDGVTWCEDKIDDNSIEYIRADIATPARPMPDNALAGTVCTVAEARGFVAFGAGVYKVTQTTEPGLVVTFRRDGEQGRAVSERAEAPDLTPIPTDDIIVKLQFTSAAGLDSLEDHLREIRAEHWPETVGGQSAKQWLDQRKGAASKEWMAGWDACRAAGQAFQAPEGADLPPLPEAAFADQQTYVTAFSADQMLDYARAALAAQPQESDTMRAEHLDDKDPLINARPDKLLPGQPQPAPAEGALTAEQIDKMLNDFAVAVMFKSLDDRKAKAEVIRAALVANQAEPDLCQNCGDLPHPGCNSEFSTEPVCRFWGPNAETLDIPDHVVEINRLRNVIQAACTGGLDHMIERWKVLFPDAPVPTVHAGQPQPEGTVAADALQSVVNVLEDVMLQSKTEDVHRRRRAAAMACHQALAEAQAPAPAPEPQISTEHGPWLPSQYEEGETYCKRCLTRNIFADKRACDPHIVQGPAVAPAIPARKSACRYPDCHCPSYDGNHCEPSDMASISAQTDEIETRFANLSNYAEKLREVTGAESDEEGYAVRLIHGLKALRAKLSQQPEAKPPVQGSPS